MCTFNIGAVCKQLLKDNFLGCKYSDALPQAETQAGCSLSHAHTRVRCVLCHWPLPYSHQLFRCIKPGLVVKSGGLKALPRRTLGRNNGVNSLI